MIVYNIIGIIRIIIKNTKILEFFVNSVTTGFKDFKEILVYCYYFLEIIIKNA